VFTAQGFALGFKDGLGMEKKIKSSEIFAPVTCPFCKKLFFIVRNERFKKTEFIDHFLKPTQHHSCFFFYQNQFLKARPVDHFLDPRRNKALPQNYSWVTAFRRPVSANRFLFFGQGYWNNNQQSVLVQDNGEVLNYNEVNPPFTSGQMVRLKRSKKLGPVSGLDLLKPMEWMEASETKEKKNMIQLVLKAKDDRWLDFHIQKIISYFAKQSVLPWALLPLPLEHKPEKESKFQRMVIVEQQETVQAWLKNFSFPPTIEFHFDRIQLEFEPRVDF